jgi:hypothetical protein
VAAHRVDGAELVISVPSTPAAVGHDRRNWVAASSVRVTSVVALDVPDTDEAVE